MNYVKIVPETITDGEGLRMAVYVAGCENKCPGCFNPETWDYNVGKELTDKVIEKPLENNALEKIKLDNLEIDIIYDNSKNELEIRKNLEKERDNLLQSISRREKLLENEFIDENILERSEKIFNTYDVDSVFFSYKCCYPETGKEDFVVNYKATGMYSMNIWLEDFYNLSKTCIINCIGTTIYKLDILNKFHITIVR